jgi:hypothetical protein
LSLVLTIWQNSKITLLESLKNKTGCRRVEFFPYQRCRFGIKQATHITKGIIG